MKTTLTIAVLMMSFASASVFAEGSKITKSTVINQTQVKDSMAIATGEGSVANLGSINISGSEVKKSTIINQSQIGRAHV